MSDGILSRLRYDPDAPFMDENIALVHNATLGGVCPFSGGRVRPGVDSKGFGPGLACVVCDCFAQPYSDLATAAGGDQ